MKEWNKIILSVKEKKEIKKVKNAVSQVKLLQRLQCLELKDKGWKHKDLAEFFDVTMNTVTNWIKAYHNGGIEALLTWNYYGRISVLTEEQQKILKQHHKLKPFDTAKEASQYLVQEFGLQFHLHWVQKILKKNFNFRIRKPV